MKTSILSSLIATTILVAGLATTASAQPKLMVITPDGHDHHDHHHNDIPTLGFYGYQTCQGMVVTEVVRGTEAARLGLERGDIIVSIDGIVLHDDGDYQFAMRRAGRHASLQVRDVRGRGIFTMKAHLHEDESPILYRSNKF